MKKLFALALLLSGILAFNTWAEAKDIKMAYIPCGRVNDKSWSEAGYIGAKQAKKFLESKGHKVKLDYTESVPGCQGRGRGTGLCCARIQSHHPPLRDLRGGHLARRQRPPQYLVPAGGGDGFRQERGCLRPLPA